MKKYFYLLIFLSIVFTVKAQNVPNGDFENWINYGAYSFPVSWRTTDSIASMYGQHSVQQDSVHVWTGKYAMKMQEWTYILTFPGAATNGTLNTTTFAFEGGTPDTVRHDMLTGWYEYNPVGGDSCSVTVTLTKWNGTSRDMVGGGAWYTTNTAAAYTQFTMPITYALTENPDTVLIVILSAPIGGSHAGTVMYIDDLNFSGVNGVNELSPNLVSVNAFPNPASDFITVEAKWKTPVKAAISILDVNGKLIQNIPFSNDKQHIDVSSFANGNYFYELMDEKGTKLYSGKFSVSH